MNLKTGKERVLTISDIQAPFHHEDTIEFLKTLKKEIKPTKVVCIGDELDWHVLGDWVSDPDGMGALDEFERGMDLMRELYSIFPKAVLLESNHGLRVFRRAFKHGIPSRFLKKYMEIIEAPAGWTYAEDVVIDGVKYEHGDRLPGGVHVIRKAVEARFQSVVFGHHHSAAGVNYIANSDGLYFAMGIGCFVDIHSYAMKYSKAYRYKPILGTGSVVCGIPQFHPMVVGKNGRWNGELVI